jgi:hypothetical protein
MRKNTDAYLDDDDYVVRDGEHVRVPLYLCDATQRAVFDAYAHQPGYRTSDAAEARDARREAREARRAWIEDMTTAWRRTPHKDASEPDAGERLLKRHLGTAEPNDDAQARRDRQWAEYCDRVSNAWRTDPRAASAIEAQAERWRGGR